jgi:hypothetical protein
MRSNLQKKNAVMPSLSPHVNYLSENAIETSPAIVFGYRSDQMSTMNYKKNYKERVNTGPHGPLRVNTGPHGPFNYPSF